MVHRSHDAVRPKERFSRPIPIHSDRIMRRLRMHRIPRMAVIFLQQCASLSTRPRARARTCTWLLTIRWLFVAFIIRASFILTRSIEGRDGKGRKEEKREAMFSCSGRFFNCYFKRSRRGTRTRFTARIQKKTKTKKKNRSKRFEANNPSRAICTRRCSRFLAVVACAGRVLKRARARPLSSCWSVAAFACALVHGLSEN